jgi:amino acid adenylation domain-containing protein
VKAASDQARGDAANGRSGGVRRAEPRSDYPLTFMQREMWFQCQLHPDTPLHRVGVAATLTGDLDRARFVRALHTVVERQAVLRTAFHASDGVPRQFILPHVDVDLTCEDVSALNVTSFDDKAVRTFVCDRFARLVGEPFDLGRAPLWRAVLLKVAEREHWLYFIFHHLIVDGYHAGAVVGEIGAAYWRAANGEREPAPPALEYPDFAVWLDQRERGLDEHEAYWLEQLRAPIAEASLPRDRVPPARRVFATDGLWRRLDPALAAALAPLGRSIRATPYRLLLAAFAAMLGRLTASREVLIGQPISTRPPELQEVAGLFANTLPIRIRLDPRQPFRAFAAAVSRQLDDARRRREFPIAEALRQVRAGRDPNTAALRVGVSQVARVDLQLPGFHLEQRPSVFGSAHLYDLWFGVMEMADEITLTFGYSMELFERESVERIATCYETLLADALRHPDRPIGDLDVLPAPDRQTVVETWNATARPYPAEACIHEIFEGHARRAPGAPALVFDSTVMSYGELDARANQLAHWLRARGVGADALVPLLFDRSPQMIVAILGVLKAGGGYVPFEPGTPPLRLRTLLADVGASVVLTERSLAGEIAAVADVAGEVLCLDDEWAAVASYSESAPDPVAVPLGTAYINFTSGSTGTPKGVLVPHRAVVRLVQNPDYIELGADDVVLQLSTYAWDAATFEIWGALLNGGRLVLIPRSTVLDFEALADVLRRERVTALYLTTTLFNQVIDQVPEALAGLKTLIVGGETASVPHFRRAVERLPRTRVINEYGPTENTAFSSWQLVARVPAGAHEIRIGRPLANSTVYVLDADLRPVPIKVKGEICLGGDGLARGYLHRPDATAERFVPNPFVPGERLYRTGDWGRWHPDGTLEFLGRDDLQVKVRGHRVEPAEVEAVLRQHPAVRDVAVLFHANAATPRLVAYVVGDGSDITTALREHAAQRLPDFLRPSVFVAVGALPLTATGKVDRRALATMEIDVRPAPVEPETELERQIAAVWRDVLDTGAIGVHDNFFDVGGDSIASVRIAARLREAGLPLKVRDLFEHQSVGALAACVQQRAMVTGAEAHAPDAPAAGVAVEDDELAALLAGDGDL